MLLTLLTHSFSIVSLSSDTGDVAGRVVDVSAAGDGVGDAGDGAAGFCELIPDMSLEDGFIPSIIDYTP